MANPPQFAILNHAAVDSGIPRESATERIGITRVPGKSLKLSHHLLVDRPLERHDQVDDLRQPLPAPLHEFRVVSAGGGRDVGFAVLSGEAQRIPLLTLPTVFAVPCLADELARNVVAELFLDFAELLDRADIGFLIELA